MKVTPGEEDHKPAKTLASAFFLRIPCQFRKVASQARSCKILPSHPPNNERRYLRSVTEMKSSQSSFNGVAIRERKEHGKGGRFLFSTSVNSRWLCTVKIYGLTSGIILCPVILGKMNLHFFSGATSQRKYQVVKLFQMSGKWFGHPSILEIFPLFSFSSHLGRNKYRIS